MMVGIKKLNVKNSFKQDTFNKPKSNYLSFIIFSNTDVFHQMTETPFILNQTVCDTYPRTESFENEIFYTM